jgi:large subunit ribosomal protein L17
MFANMAAALIEHEQIVTHAAEGEGAPSDRREAGDARQARRPARAPPGDLRDRASPACKKLFETIGRATRTGQGLHPCAQAGFRYGDNAPVAVIEFVDRDVDAKGAADPRGPRRLRPRRKFCTLVQV